MPEQILPDTLALDLEGTTIFHLSWCPHGRPEARLGLSPFLEWARLSFRRLVIFSAVPAEGFRLIAKILVEHDEAPAWFIDLEHFHATTDLSEGFRCQIKDLRRVDPVPGKVVLVDDQPDKHLPDEQFNKCQYLGVHELGRFDGINDHGLYAVAWELSRRLRGLEPRSTPIWPLHLGEDDEAEVLATILARDHADLGGPIPVPPDWPCFWIGLRLHEEIPKELCEFGEEAIKLAWIRERIHVLAQDYGVDMEEAENLLAERREKRRREAEDWAAEFTKYNF